MPNFIVSYLRMGWKTLLIIKSYRKLSIEWLKEC